MLLIKISIVTIVISVLVAFLQSTIYPYFKGLFKKN